MVLSRYYLVGGTDRVGRDLGSCKSDHFTPTSLLRTRDSYPPSNNDPRLFDRVTTVYQRSRRRWEFQIKETWTRKGWEDPLVGT